MVADAALLELRVVVSDPMAELVAQAQRGDGEALASLIRQTERWVYNLAFRILRNRQEAEDLAQEVYLRVWRALPSFRGESKFTTWLYAIATNACLNRRRRLRRDLAVSIEDDDLEMLSAAHLPDHTPPAVPGDEREYIWAQVQQLPAKYALVLTLFYQQQLTYDEIAEMLAMPLGTVKAQLSRARRALAATLREDGAQP